MGDVRREVRGEVLRRFSAQAIPEVLQALADLETPPSSPEWSRTRARVQLAVLKVADGDVSRFFASVTLASADWRDVLCEAGLENDDWPAVLEASGYARPK